MSTPPAREPMPLEGCHRRSHPSPYEFDVVFSKYVFEHLDRLAAALLELRRVMRPGGHLLPHTPNRWHYVTHGATVTPTRFHS
jgi:SAM-dependent methyltransferase